MTRPALTAAAFLVASAAVAADDWPAWRGPTADGVAPATANPPVKWDEKTNVKWKVEIPGKGSASPVVLGNQVFVLTAVRTDREAKPAELPKRDPKLQIKTDPPKNFFRFEVRSHDRATGELKWSAAAAEAVPHEGHHPTHSYAGGSPATDGKRVYAAFGSFGVFAYTLDGKPVWKRDFGRLNTRFGWGEAVTPVVHAGAVVLNLDQETDSKLVVLDAATGETRWSANRDEKTTWSTPLVVPHGKRMLVIANGKNRVRAYDLADGAVVWEVGGMTTNPIPSPIAADGVAFVMSGYQGAAAVAVPLGRPATWGPTGRSLGGTARGRPTSRRPCCTRAGCSSRRGTRPSSRCSTPGPGKPC